MKSGWRGRAIILWWLGLFGIAQAHPPPVNIPGLISRGLEPAGVRAGPALRAFAQRFASEAALTYLNGPTSAGAAAGAIDSSQGVLGPIFLSTAATVGAGNTNVNVVSEYSETEPNLSNPGLLLVEKGLDTFAARIAYNLRLSIADVAIAVSYGVTDNLDISLLFLMVYADMNVAASGSIVRKQANGGFKPIPRSPTKSGSQSVANFGPGDTALRFKYKLPDIGRFQLAVNTEFQFPTGDAALLHGTGDYWITPTVDVHTSFFGGKADATLNLGMDFNVNSATDTQALYGLGFSGMIIPRCLAGVVEFLGRSELDSIPTPNSSGAFYILPDKTIVKQPLFNFDLGRHDYFDLSFGLRMMLGHGLIGFVNGIYAINKVGLHDHQLIPVVGIGATF